MTLLNQNGTPYKLKGSMQQFDPAGKVHSLLDTYDEEWIKITGSPVEYYEILIQMQTVDPIYLEDRGRLYSPVPMQLWAVYEPPQQQSMSGIFGIDTPDEEIILEMNYRAVLRDLGHQPKIGSRVFTPHRGENWVIIDYRLDQFKLWGAIRLQLHCKKYQETSSASNGEVQQQPDFKITDYAKLEPEYKLGADFKDHQVFP
jgi:hypothetical protein